MHTKNLDNLIFCKSLVLAEIYTGLLYMTSMKKIPN